MRVAGLPEKDIYFFIYIYIILKFRKECFTVLYKPPPVRVAAFF